MRAIFIQNSAFTVSQILGNSVSWEIYTLSVMSEVMNLCKFSLFPFILECLTAS